jgi:hypothetical protein
MNLSGKWDGKLLDTSGPMALITLNLKGDGAAVAGDFEMAFVSVEDGCCRSSRMPAQVGSVKGRVDDKSGQIRLEYEVSIGLKPVKVSFTANVVKADPHARRAMLGCYAIDNRDGPLSLEGGACVLWQFVEQKPAKSSRAKKGG